MVGNYKKKFSLNYVQYWAMCWCPQTYIIIYYMGV